MEFEESLVRTEHELRRPSPSLSFQTVDGKVHFVYKRVAVVEQFFDIIYSVHVESAGDTQLRGRAGKHCGQKRTYRAVSTLPLGSPKYLFCCGLRRVRRRIPVNCFPCVIFRAHHFLPQPHVQPFPSVLLPTKKTRQNFNFFPFIPCAFVYSFECRRRPPCSRSVRLSHRASEVRPRLRSISLCFCTVALGQKIGREG